MFGFASCLTGSLSDPRETSMAHTRLIVVARQTSSK